MPELDYFSIQLVDVSFSLSKRLDDSFSGSLQSIVKHFAEALRLSAKLCHLLLLQVAHESSSYDSIQHAVRDCLLLSARML